MAIFRRRVWVLVAALCLSVGARAGGPRWFTGKPFYASEGLPVVFFTMNPLYYTDPGALNANVSHAQADAMVAAAAATWNVPTSALTLAQGGTLAEHVSSANAYFDGTSVVFPDDVKLENYHAKPIVIIYDTDGSVIDTLLGSGASSPSGCRQNGVVESVDGLDPAGTIDHAILILNGRCVGANPDQMLQMQYQLMRKFGRIIGVGWAQVNDNLFTGIPAPTSSQIQNWAVMHPIDVLCGPYTYKCMVQPFVLHADDLSTLVQLYPVNAGNITAGKTLSMAGAADVFGFIHFPTGQGMDGVNVVLTRTIAFAPQDKYQITSAVTGSIHQQIVGNPVSGPATGVGDSVGTANSYLEGLYWMQRIPLTGYFESLDVTTEPINPLYSGAYAIGPYVGQPKMMSGAPVTMEAGLVVPGYEVVLSSVITDAPSSCNTGNDGVEAAPVAADPSGWWSNLLCSNGHTAWASQSVKAGHSWTLEMTAVDENGIGSSRKARLLAGVWKSGDALGTLPTVAATGGALNAMVVGMTQLHMDASSAAESYRIAIADDRGQGRPDFAYTARVLYADSITPVQVGASGGRITIAGQGFRNGNVVKVNGVVARVISWSATQIVATAPTLSAAGMTAAGFADVAVVDAGTGGTTVIQSALGYGGTAVNSISLVSAPGQVKTGVASSVAFAVRVLDTDGNPAVGAAVRFTATGAAATFGVCGAAACTMTTDANGLAQSFITAGAVGSITLTATELSGGAFVQVSVNAVAPVVTIVLVSAPVQVTTGVASSVAFAVKVLTDGVPAPGATVQFSSTGAASTFAVCGAAVCTLTTDANGAAQSVITASAAGTITLSATEKSGGALVRAVVNAVAPVVTIELVTAPVQVTTGVVSSVAFAVKVLTDGLPALGASVQISSTGAADTFAVCGAAICTLTTDANGFAQSVITPTAAGSITLTATERSGGAFVQASVTAVDPVRSVVVVNAPRYLAAGAAAGWPVGLVAMQDGVAAVGQTVVWTATAGLSLSGTTGVIDAGGAASVGVSTAGLGAGQQAVVQGCVWTTVCATASVFGVDPSLWTVSVVSGAGQSVNAAMTLTPVVLQVTDGSGHVVEAATVVVYQTVDAWEGVCPVQGRCAAAPVLAASQKTLTTDANGQVTVTPLEVAGVASVVNIAAVTGTQGFVSLSLAKTP